MEKYKLMLKNNGIVKVILFILAVAVLIYSGLGYFNQPSAEMLVMPVELESESQELVKDSTEEAVNPDESIEQLIYAEIKGEVNQPGVYQLEEGNRVINLIEQANGLTNMAAADAINQAMIVTDQMSVIVPNIEQWEQNAVSNEVAVQTDFVSETTDVTTININTADSMTLQNLPGIGPKKAEAIILYREEQGSFQQVEEMMNISGIGEKTFEKLAPYIRVGD